MTSHSGITDDRNSLENPASYYQSNIEIHHSDESTFSWTTVTFENLETAVAACDYFDNDIRFHSFLPMKWKLMTKLFIRFALIDEDDNSQRRGTYAPDNKNKNKNKNKSNKNSKNKNNKDKLMKSHTAFVSGKHVIESFDSNNDYVIDFDESQLDLESINDNNNNNNDGDDASVVDGSTTTAEDSIMNQTLSALNQLKKSKTDSSSNNGGGKRLISQKKKNKTGRDLNNISFDSVEREEIGRELLNEIKDRLSSLDSCWIEPLIDIEFYNHLFYGFIWFRSWYEANRAIKFLEGDSVMLSNGQKFRYVVQICVDRSRPVYLKLHKNERHKIDSIVKALKQELYFSRIDRAIQRGNNKNKEKKKNKNDSNNNTNNNKSKDSDLDTGWDETILVITKRFSWHSDYGYLLFRCWTTAKAKRTEKELEKVLLRLKIDETPEIIEESSELRSYQIIREFDWYLFLLQLLSFLIPPMLWIKYIIDKICCKQPMILWRDYAFLGLFRNEKFKSRPKNVCLFFFRFLTVAKKNVTQCVLFVDICRMIYDL